MHSLLKKIPAIIYRSLEPTPVEEENEITDEMLMLQVGKGDEDAFAVLVRRHQDMVYGTAARMLGGSASEAEDVAQQVFIKAYRAASRYQPTAKFTTWLLTICRNTVFTHTKLRKRYITEPLEYETDEGTQESHIADVNASNPSDQMMHGELETAIQAALDLLPEKQRMALVLRQYDQLEYEEIARIMKTSVSSIKSLLFRARDTLREALKQHLSAT